MQNDALSKPAVSFGLSLAICSLFNALLVIAKEKSPVVQSAMQKLTGHHWVTHVVLVLALFFILGFLFANVTSSVNRLIKWVVACVVISGLVIVGFYLLAD
ncbi:MAG TPA: hypothetical protein VGY56_04010 [Verrucomicrobiae bacterium]|nr:hypothetical protein [Verrucomicrobiae bacterium]